MEVAADGTEAVAGRAEKNEAEGAVRARSLSSPPAGGAVPRRTLWAGPGRGPAAGGRCAAGTGGRQRGPAPGRYGRRGPRAAGGTCPPLRCPREEHAAAP